MSTGIDAELTMLLRSPLGGGAAALWGALWGSFGALCVYRVPRGESVLRPASHCPGCRRDIAWYDNVPILSWLLLRGRCRRCAAPIPVRDFACEILFSIVALILFWRFVTHGDGPWAVLLSRFLVYFFFVGTLGVLSLIDLERQIIPDRITYPAIPVFFLLGQLIGSAGLWDRVIGAVAGYLVVRLVSDGYYYLTGNEGLGYGDGKLLAIVGGLLGWQALPWTLLMASLGGIVISVPVLLWQRRQQARAGAEPAPLRQTAVPFGPFLSLGATAYLLVLHGRDAFGELARLLGPV